MSRRDTGFSPATTAAIIERDRGRCARCGVPVAHLERGLAWSIHHRAPRKMGGRRDEWIGQAANGVILCGSGVTGCHGWVERNRSEARDTGWLIPMGVQRPDTTAIQHAVHGYVHLTDDGGWEKA